MTQNKERQYKKALIDLTTSVATTIHNIDKIIQRPTSTDRGEKIGEALNKLESQNDSIMLFTLNYYWPKINRLKGLNHNA